jgi:hypothetical protein
MRAIDGDALKEEIGYYIREAGWGETRNETLRWCLEFIDNQPTIESERKKGKWIDDHCSECGCYVYHGDVRNFCPNCGSYNGGDEDG